MTQTVDPGSRGWVEHFHQFADGSITTPKLANGAVTTPKIADGAVTNAKLAADTARRNLLINGGHELWQRGNGPFAAGSYSSDRWVVYGGGASCSVSRQTVTPDGSASAATLTLGGGGVAGIYQILEDHLQLRGRTISASIRVACSQATSVRFGFSPDKAGSLPAVWSAYHSGSGAYETLTVTYAIPAGAAGLTLWVIGTVAGTPLLDNCMAVVGSAAGDYAPLTPQEELARCQRYYQILNMTSTVIGGSGTTGQREFLALAYPTEMGGNPTVTISGAATWSPSSVSTTTPTMHGATPNVISLSVTASATTEFFLQGLSTARIALEWNP